MMPGKYLDQESAKMDHGSVMIDETIIKPNKIISGMIMSSLNCEQTIYQLLQRGGEEE